MIMIVITMNLSRQIDICVFMILESLSADCAISVEWICRKPILRLFDYLRATSRKLRQLVWIDSYLKYGFFLNNVLWYV